jgi:MATE family multidrug resistance protein
VTEFKTITRHALSVLAGQLATMAFGVTDTIVAGQFAEQSLAALSVGSAIYMSVFVGLMGVLQALLPIWAELHGAKQSHKVGYSFRQALYLCSITMVLGMVVLLFPGSLLDWGQVPPALRPDITTYLAVLALALPPALLFRLYSTLNQSLGKPLLVTWLQIGSLGLKIPLSIWLTFGGLGVPALGVVGCAVATLVVNYVMLLLAFYLLRTRALYRPLHLWARMEKPDWGTIGEFARMGVPGGLAVLVEVTSFTLMALFIARQGTAAAASHQIAANLAAVLYMMPLALGIATSARTSFWLGAGQALKAKHAVSLGFRMGLFTSLCLAMLMWLLRAPLAGLYAKSPEVVNLAVSLLGWIALYHVFDAMQAIGVFVLRCFRITIAPMLIYGVFLWGVGLYGGYVLAYEGLGSWPAMHSPVAFWLAGIASVVLTSVIFWVMIWQLLQREERP